MNICPDVFTLTYNLFLHSEILLFMCLFKIDWISNMYELNNNIILEIFHYIHSKSIISFPTANTRNSVVQYFTERAKLRSKLAEASI